MLGDLECVIVKDPDCEKPKAAVILCHGFGAPPNDLFSLAQAFMANEGPLQNLVYVFPAAPIELDPLFDARAWWMIDMEKIQQLMMNGETRELKGTSPEELPKRRIALTKVIDHCRVDYDLPASKIVIGGFSQGAMLSTDVALNYPEPLGGLIVWSGSLINESAWTEKSKAQSGLKIVQSHGRIDPILPMSGAEDLRDMLKDSGHTVQFCEFDGQHSIPMEAIELATELIKEACE